MTNKFNSTPNVSTKEVESQYYREDAPISIDTFTPRSCSSLPYLIYD